MSGSAATADATLLPSSVWESVFDALEERVRAQEAFLDGTGPVPPPLALTLPAAPMPADMVVRASAVLDRVRELEARAVEAIERLPVPRANAYRS